MSNTKILILPGWQDSGPKHWQSLWLEKYEGTAKVVQDDWERPRREEWVERLDEYVRRYAGAGVWRGAAGTGQEMRGSGARGAGLGHNAAEMRYEMECDRGRDAEGDVGCEIVLVGHSLACATFAYWSRDFWDEGTRVKGALMVSPSDVELENFPEEITGFAPMPLEKLKFPAVVVASEDDPYVSLERAEEFAGAWGAELVNIGARGHINAESGLGEWGEGWELVGRVID